MLTIIEQENESSLFLIAHLYLFLDYFVRSSFNHTELTGGNLKDLYIREGSHISRAKLFSFHYY